MIYNLLKSALRSLYKNKTFTIITTGSFSISLSILLLLTSFIVSEYRYDHHLSEVDYLYRIENDDNALVPEEARELLLDQVPEIESVTNYMIRQEPVVFEGQNHKARIINSDESLFSVLPIEFIAGSPAGIFDVSSHAIITESLAKRIFGESDPMGKTLTVSHREDLIVAGVIKDFPSKSTFHGDLICSTALKITYSSSCYDNKCTYYYMSLVKLNTTAAISELNHKINEIINEGVDDNKGNKEYFLSTYKNIYFNTKHRDQLEHANDQLINLLGWLALILLLLSIFNYINLSIANSAERLREFGVKKTLGALKSSITFQLVLESVICILLAGSLATGLAYLLYPLFEELFGKPFLVMEVFSTWKLGIVSISALLLLAILSALYPAYVAAKGEVKDLISKKPVLSGGVFRLRKALNIAQFVVTIIVLISLITIYKQINYVKVKDFGFSTEQLVIIPVHYKARDKATILRKTIAEIPGVKSICTSGGVPGEIRSMSNNDEVGNIDVIGSDHSFTETFELSLISGRNMFENEEKVCLINESAFKKTGWDTFEGKKLFGSEVIGIIEDFHFKDLYHSIGPLMIMQGNGFSNLTIRIYPQNISQTMEKIEDAYHNVLPDYEYSYQFYDEFLDSMYKKEEERARSIQIMAFVTIFISCIGLIGLVEYSTKKRIKEIGIRKVNGAKVTEILRMLNKDFVIWILIAFVLAIPISWYAMDQWLQSFAYKTELSWWIFLLGGLLTMTIALLTVSWQSWKAATNNPVEALKYE